MQRQISQIAEKVQNKGSPAGLSMKTREGKAMAGLFGRGFLQGSGTLSILNDFSLWDTPENWRSCPQIKDNADLKQLLSLGSSAPQVGQSSFG